MRASARRTCLAASIIAALVLAVALVPAQAQYARPKSAIPFNVSLVPAFQFCGAPNSQHGPPLESASCNPPVPSSNAVTVGTPENNSAGDNSVGTVKVNVQPGIPGPPDDSDILIRASVSDVRCIGDTTACGNTNAADGPDYIGELQGNGTVRITDRFNAFGGGATEAGTVVDLPFVYYFDCAATADVDIGALCTANTSINAVISPGAVRDGKRAIWALSQAQVFDGGPDGDLTTGPNTPFLRQGLFVP